MNKNSKTDWARLESMTDDEIDTSDIPPLDENFFIQGELRLPKNKAITNTESNSHLTNHTEQ